MSYIGVSASPTPAGVYTKAESETRLATKLSAEGGEITGGLTVNPPIGESFVKLKSNTVGATSEVMLRGSNNDGFDTAYNSTLDQFRVSRYVNDVYQNSPLAIDSAGRVTMPYQVGFSADSVSPHSQNGTGGNITYTTVQYNVGNHYNSSTGIFTCPVAGKYLVLHSQLTYSNGDAFYLQKNGTTIAAAYTSTTTWNQVALTRVVDCAANDTLNLKAGIIYLHSGHYGMFSIHLLG